QLGANNAIPQTSSVTLSAVTEITPPPRSTIIVLESGSLDLNNFSDTIGSLSSDILPRDLFQPLYPVILGTRGTNTLNTGADGSSTTFNGVISGAGGLTKIGSGTFTLLGNNTYSGGTTVQAGTLVVDGSCGNVILNGGTLGGFGTVASIGALSGATVYPGAATVNPVTLHSGNIAAFASGSTFQVQAKSATNYDQLSVGGLVSLGAA